VTASVLGHTGAAAYGNLDRLAGGQGSSRHTGVLDVANPGVRAALDAFDESGLDVAFGWSKLVRLIKSWGDPVAVDRGSEPDFQVVDQTTGAVLTAQVRSGGYLILDSNAIAALNERIIAVSNIHRSVAYDVVVRLSATGTGSGIIGARPHFHVSVYGGDSQTFRARELTDVNRRPPIDVSGDAVTTVRALAELLGVPVGDILKASEISKSSFHSWDKPSRPKPRLSSEGALWALADTANELADSVDGSVAKWMRADRSRRRLLRSGQFDELLDQLYERPHERGEGAAPLYALTAGVHDEPEGPLAERPIDGGARQGRARAARVARKATRPSQPER
jgi:hypothetical protein